MKEELKLIISENDNIYQTLLSHGVEISDIQEQISVIGSKVYNNKIGYIKLDTKNFLLKLVVCPKIFDYNEKEYLKYIKKCFSIINKHRSKIKLFKVDNSIIELAKLTEKIGDTHSFDDILNLKYQSVLEEIRFFFRKNKAYQIKTIDYSSYSLEHELDIYGNIVDPLKTQIHQKKALRNIQAELADIATSILDFFIRRTKLKLDKKIISMAIRINSEIKRNFKVRHNKKSTKKFIDGSYNKYFNNRNKNELKNNLNFLLSKDSFFSSKNNSLKSQNSLTSNSIFFEANMLYELIVYESLVNNYPNSDVIIKPKKEILINSKNEKTFNTTSSEPDFLIESKESLILVDAKWKKLISLNSKFNYDYLKLSRDKDIYKADQIIVTYPIVQNTILNSSPFHFGNNKNSPIHISEVSV